MFFIILNRSLAILFQNCLLLCLFFSCRSIAPSLCPRTYRHQKRRWTTEDLRTRRWTTTPRRTIRELWNSFLRHWWNPSINRALRNRAASCHNYTSSHGSSSTDSRLAQKNSFSNCGPRFHSPTTRSPAAMCTLCHHRPNRRAWAPASLWCLRIWRPGSMNPARTNWETRPCSTAPPPPRPARYGAIGLAYRYRASSTQPSSTTSTPSVSVLGITDSPNLHHRPFFKLIRVISPCLHSPLKSTTKQYIDRYMYI